MTDRLIYIVPNEASEKIGISFGATVSQIPKGGEKSELIYLAVEVAELWHVTEMLKTVRARMGEIKTEPKEIMLSAPLYLGVIACLRAHAKEFQHSHTCPDCFHYDGFLFSCVCEAERAVSVRLKGPAILRAAIRINQEREQVRNMISAVVRCALSPDCDCAECRNARVIELEKEQMIH